MTQEWATTQFNLGNALWVLGQRAIHDGGLVDALAHGEEVAVEVVVPADDESVLPLPVTSSRTVRSGSGAPFNPVQ
ncbi:hypothetical protein [Archangium lipolyticum]|uniref:hypothetical protein n=1 Tax=Archangium lipolyticum TaxID=2970465 RepID=UPI00214A22DF|nr:hypothetical protein [Archangium lipolyticum]